MATISRIALSSVVAYAGAVALGVGISPIALAVSVTAAKVCEWASKELGKNYFPEECKHPFVRSAMVLSAHLLGCFAGVYINLNYIGSFPIATIAESFLATEVSGFFAEVLNIALFSPQPDVARSV